MEKIGYNFFLSFPDFFNFTSQICAGVTLFVASFIASEHFGLVNVINYIKNVNILIMFLSLERWPCRFDSALLTIIQQILK